MATIGVAYFAERPDTIPEGTWTHWTAGYYKNAASSGSEGSITDDSWPGSATMKVERVLIGEISERNSSTRLGELEYLVVHGRLPDAGNIPENNALVPKNFNITLTGAHANLPYTIDSGQKTPDGSPMWLVGWGDNAPAHYKDVAVQMLRYNGMANRPVPVDRPKFPVSAVSSIIINSWS